MAEKFTPKYDEEYNKSIGRVKPNTSTGTNTSTSSSKIQVRIPAIILEIIAPILIIIGYQTRIAAGALSLFCLATAIIFHTDFSDQMQFVAFMKNLALAGGFLFLVVNGAKGYCLDKK